MTTPILFKAFHTINMSLISAKVYFPIYGLFSVEAKTDDSSVDVRRFLVFDMNEKQKRNKRAREHFVFRS